MGTGTGTVDTEGKGANWVGTRSGISVSRRKRSGARRTHSFICIIPPRSSAFSWEEISSLALREDGIHGACTLPGEPAFVECGTDIWSGHGFCSRDRFEEFLKID